MVSSRTFLVSFSTCLVASQAWVGPSPLDGGIRPTALMAARHAASSVECHDATTTPSQNDNDDATSILQSRRQIISQLASTSTAAVLLSGPWSSLPARADDTAAASTPPPLYVKTADKFAYQFQPPPDFDAGNKPLKTHLDEINFKSISTSGYQFGITVDPVRIQSLSEFGTPEELAAKVVLAEVNRDGVFDVTLMQDPLAAKSLGNTEVLCYQLNYVSKGKRGEKRFVTKFYVQNQFLFALTAQCKEVNYPTFEKELLQAVDSFQLVL